MTVMRFVGNNKNVRLAIQSLAKKFGKMTIYEVSDKLHKHPSFRQTIELAFNVKISV